MHQHRAHADAAGALDIVRQAVAHHDRFGRAHARQLQGSLEDAGMRFQVAVRGR
jgi:hypothetical protein